MRVTDGIESEIFVAVHVVVVVPYYIEWDLGLSVILHDVFHDGEVPVAPSALVKPYKFQFTYNKIIFISKVLNINLNAFFTFNFLIK